MKKKLSLLEELQTLDRTIDDKCLAQTALRAEIAGNEQDVAAFRQAHETNLAQMADLERQKNELENALATELDNIKRSESHVKEIRTNKEFQAVGREISTARKQVGELEEQILGLTTRTDELRAVLEAQQAELLSREESGRAVATEKSDMIDSLQREVDAATAGREAIVSQLPANLVRRYQQLREQRRGQALAEVQGGSCLGCNMHLPPQLYNTLFRGDELLFCPHCQRILILKQEQAQQ
ncbi:zinc ribbon domain-containing protein [Trichlorobacter ammonificans]|uniref:Zf-RING_7 domain-containing protein n=1 Tax=Trichlorobacter ammonificans TaxID=2916410 RepID=A0ABN8HJN5_9BACT|nr:C4-type zinc ribbon domain-containing protein [Trichlorobacter ammonificans]CAH2032239.1 zf-RING_7 domain-containing protein [Trichlorobacter ammonificans]